jgi:hypothetical protein
MMLNFQQTGYMHTTLQQYLSVYLFNALKKTPPPTLTAITLPFTLTGYLEQPNDRH